VFSYNPWNKADFIRDSGHIYIQICIFSNDVKFKKLPLVFDPGAYITVITRENARWIGLPLTGVYTANLTGFNKERGTDEAEIVIAPKIEIGKIILEEVKILVPLKDIEIPEVIGENILEYFSYTVDRKTENIFFSKNPNPKPYINSDKGINLSCGRVLSHDA
jgi:predicted aspartyl protease